VEKKYGPVPHEDRLLPISVTVIDSIIFFSLFHSLSIIVYVLLVVVGGGARYQSRNEYINCSSKPFIDEIVFPQIWHLYPLLFSQHNSIGILHVILDMTSCITITKGRKRWRRKTHPTDSFTIINSRMIIQCIPFAYNQTKVVAVAWCVFLVDLFFILLRACWSHPRWVVQHGMRAKVSGI